MEFSSKAIANEFLSLADRDEVLDVSPMKLQKLVYYAQGWHLGEFGGMLVREQVECWPYGPVFDSLFHEFKDFGSDRINRLAVRRKFVVEDLPGSPGKRIPRFLRVTPRVAKNEKGTLDFIESIWDSYKEFSAIKLSNMTHAEGGPWKKVFDKYNGRPPRGTDIPVDWIENYFKSLAAAR